jgi:hypothetical protein
MKVRMYGCAGLPSGYGYAATELAMCMVGAGIDLELRLFGGTKNGAYLFDDHSLDLEKTIRQDDDLDPSPDVVIVHALPLQCWPILQQSGFAEKKPGGPLRIAYTTYEGIGPVPIELAEILGAFDQIWVPSHQNANCFAFTTKRECVYMVPHSFPEASLESRRSQRPAKSDRYSFWYFGHWNARKNPDGLVRAWARAFTEDDPVELVLYCPETTREEHLNKLHMAMLLTGSGVCTQMAPIRLIGKRLSDAEVWDLPKQHDCYVTATRGEAFNIPAFFACLGGRQVIHPANLGATDFLADYGRLYPGYPAPGSEEAVLAQEKDGVRVTTLRWDGVNAKSLWQEPDLLKLAHHMREAYKFRETTGTTSNHDRDLIDRFGRRGVGARIKTILEESCGNK